MTTRYRLIFRGRYLPGMPPETVVANLAALFKTTAENILHLLETVPAVIKKDISHDDGNRYQEALARAGLITHLEPVDAAATGQWNGAERRQGQRRKNHDRREDKREHAIQPDRRQGTDRRRS